MLVLTNIKSLAGIRDASVKMLRGKELATLPSIENAFLIAPHGKIKVFGPMKDFKNYEAVVKNGNVIDCTDKIVLPSFCDSHTHLVFADTRENEFIDKINGLSYEEIAAKGGGILNSAKKLNEMSEETLYEKSFDRLNEIIKQGTGAVEIKSGYGLCVEGELKMLRLIKKLKEHSPIPIKATFLGAHAFPAEFKNNHDGYIKLIIEKMLPQIAEENLADYIDAFCENGFFSMEETDRILEAGNKFGLKPKIHANQLAISGGVQTGIKNNAISVDHLENIGDEEIFALQNSNTIPTLLPSAAFFLRMNYPPARKLIDANLPVTLATDFNPGSSPSSRMSFVISLACLQMKMTPEEAINAATLNGAHAMELESEVGSVTIGKTANLIITKKINSVANIPYSFGNDVIDKVIVNGEVF